MTSESVCVRCFCCVRSIDRCHAWYVFLKFAAKNANKAGSFAAAGEPVSGQGEQNKDVGFSRGTRRSVIDLCKRIMCRRFGVLQFKLTCLDAFSLVC